MKRLRTFLFSYNYEGRQYQIEIRAYSQVEAVGRMKALCRSWGYDGESYVRIYLPSFVGDTFDLISGGKYGQ